MTRRSHWIRRILFASALLLPIGAMAQVYGYRPYYGGGPQLFVGASLGPTLYSDQSGMTAGWLNSTYNSSTTLAPGDFITSSGSQDRSDFGGKVYAGAWFTPNLGVEVGFASLGQIRWSVYSTNTTGSFSVNDSGHVDPYATYQSLLLGFDAYGVKYFGKLGVYEAQTYLRGNSYDNNSGGYFSVSENASNTGAMFGLGIQVPIGRRLQARLEAEDFVNVGETNSSQLPPWRGNVLLLSGGVSFLF